MSKSDRAKLAATRLRGFFGDGPATGWPEVERLGKELRELAGDVTAVDKGPWTAERWPDGRVVIQSDQFEHDVSLIVNGDFTDDEQRMAYAQALAAQLNAAIRKG